MAKFIVSLSPHEHNHDSVQNNMYGVLIALIPALAVSFVCFGLGAAIVTLTSIAACVLFEWAITKFILKRERTTICDGSAVLTGLLLAFNLPSNLPIWVILIGAFVAIGIGKMSFGGLGCNPLNPALVGRVFLLVSFPVQMTSWPTPGQYTSYLDAVTSATPLMIMKDAIKTGDASVLSELPSFTDMLLGYTGGSFGEVSALALIIGCIFMLVRKIITWHIPISIIVTTFCFSGAMHLIDPTFATPTAHILSGGLLLGACFMATDYVSSPMTPKGQLIYGSAIGFLTVVIRSFGSYPEGMSFAILIMNFFTPLINIYCKPKRFGEVLNK